MDERDALKAEMSVLKRKLMERVSWVQKRNSDIENCMFTIDRYEKEMAQIKQKFEQILQNRNFTGLLLIDRNDELCLLYEKSNLYQRIQSQGQKLSLLFHDDDRSGDLELKRKHDELRVLQIQWSDVVRSISASKKLKQQIPSLDQAIARLKAELLEAKETVEHRSIELEDPSNPQRWRALEGVDLEPEQLEAKLRQLRETIQLKSVILRFLFVGIVFVNRNKVLKEI